MGAGITFASVFRHLFVYNMLFEDTEVDERLLSVDPTSRLLGISGAGCGMATHLSRRPASIDAVDINANHLAITGLKMSAAKNLRSYGEFYSLWGFGRHPNPDRVTRRLTEHMPRWVQRHWHTHHRLFSRSFYRFGLTSRLFAVLRRLAQVDGRWLKTLIADPVATRQRRIVDCFSPVFARPWVAALLRSPLHLVAIGVSGEQRDRMLHAEHAKDMIEYLIMHLVRVAETDLERNWFAWHAVTGGFNHEREDALPPYLRRDHHETAFQAQTDIRLHHRNIFDVLSSAGPKTWTHYTLLDAPDWMPDQTRRHLFREILRTSVDGAVVLHRSVEKAPLPPRLGLERRFRPMMAETELATRMDRTRQFQSVNFYRVEH